MERKVKMNNLLDDFNKAMEDMENLREDIRQILSSILMDTDENNTKKFSVQIPGVQGSITSAYQVPGDGLVVFNTEIGHAVDYDDLSDFQVLSILNELDNMGVLEGEFEYEV